MSETISVLGRTERAMCQKHVEQLLSTVPGVVGVLVCSVDGFEVASRLRPPLTAERMSAMTSSQLALGEALCNETGSGTCLNVVIEAEAGRLLMLSVPARRRRMLLTVLCEQNSVLGSVLWAARACAQDIGRRLDDRL
ncbi:MAG: roadblock/LC7 domain-containing protein [Xanthomonadaceae bacterium]|nr:roadblock/LC7 domain-containing protein [Xanthomonadaceae bacterium]